MFTVDSGISLLIAVVAGKSVGGSSVVAVAVVAMVDISMEATSIILSVVLDKIGLVFVVTALGSAVLVIFFFKVVLIFDAVGSLVVDRNFGSSIVVGASSIMFCCFAISASFLSSTLLLSINRWLVV